MLACGHGVPGSRWLGLPSVEAGAHGEDGSSHSRRQQELLSRRLALGEAAAAAVAALPHCIGCSTRRQLQWRRTLAVAPRHPWKLARTASMHRPRLIIGEGQGALVALGYSHPGFLEAVMASRNVQPAEFPELSQAWGNVAAVVAHRTEVPVPPPLTVSSSV